MPPMGFASIVAVIDPCMHSMLVGSSRAIQHDSAIASEQLTLHSQVTHL